MIKTNDELNDILGLEGQKKIQKTLNENDLFSSNGFSSFNEKMFVNILDKNRYLFLSINVALISLLGLICFISFVSTLIFVSLEKYSMELAYSCFSCLISFPCFVIYFVKYIPKYEEKIKNWKRVEDIKETFINIPYKTKLKMEQALSLGIKNFEIHHKNIVKPQDYCIIGESNSNRYLIDYWNVRDL